MADGCRVVEVPILKVCYGGISHISRILVGAAAAVAVVVVTVVWSPHLGLSSLPQCIALGNRWTERNRVTHQGIEISYQLVFNRVASGSIVSGSFSSGPSQHLWNNRHTGGASVNLKK